MVLALILNMCLVGCAVYAAVVLDRLQDSGMELPWILYVLVFLSLCTAMFTMVTLLFRMKPLQENALSLRIEKRLLEDQERIRKAKKKLDHH